MTTAESNRYIGLISGTSADGIDAVAADLSDDQFQIAAFCTYPYSDELNQQLQPLLDAEHDIDLNTLGLIDAKIGDAFADAAKQIIHTAGWHSKNIAAIGSHGQTIIHSPDTNPPFSLQLGDANRIADQTGLTVVADFRRADLAAGGQAAPYAPLIHRALFQTIDTNQAVVNTGGIANVSWLSADTDQPVIGFDSGPANCLMNAWCRQHLQQPFDDQGQWAASGQPQTRLLENWLADEYFARPYPKSTGREYFTLDWLKNRTPNLSGYQPQDIQATLLQLTVISIRDAIQQCGDADKVIICGGGAHNLHLMKSLSEAMPGIPVTTTDALGISADAIEALLFAWLAKQRLQHQFIDTRSITGANRPVLLGNLFQSN